MQTQAEQALSANQKKGKKERKHEYSLHRTVVISVKRHKSKHWAQFDNNKLKMSVAFPIIGTE